MSSRLRVVQYGTDDTSVCASWSYPPMAPAERSISDTAHHAKLFAELTLDVRAHCGPRFEAWVELGVTSGLPVRVEDTLRSGVLSLGAVSGE